MNNIGKDEHLETLVGSINKMFSNARNQGVIRNKEISLLNLIYKLLKKRAYTGGQEQQLLSLYYKIANKYPFICKAPLNRYYYYEQTGINNTYIPDTCLDFPKYKKIFFWQEESHLTLNGGVLSKVNTSGFLISKESDTYESFALGRNTNQTYYGKVCFALTETTLSDNYQIYDNLGLNVTHAFSKTYIPEIDVTLFVSTNNYSFGNTQYKIT